jgi:hypothetical protein
VNLLFLVEGKKTETRVYRAWLRYLFPHLSFVLRLEDITENTCLIISGNGIQAMFSKPKIEGGLAPFEACLNNIKNFGNIDHFFICIDSEEYSYSDRYNEVKTKLDDAKPIYNIDEAKTEIHIIIQYHCFETWALGNAEIPNRCIPKKFGSTLFTDLQAHYDVLLNDPETMPHLKSIHGEYFSTNARFHKHYMAKYAEHFGLRYSSKNPRLVEENWYLDALKMRCQSTSHLSSLKLFLDTIHAIATSGD